MADDKPILDCETIDGPIDDVRFGPGVRIECGHFAVGPGVAIGVAEAKDAFRHPGGVLIQGDEVRLAAGVSVGRAVRIAGQNIRIDPGARIGHGTSIDVVREFRLASGGTIHDHAEIVGYRVVIGRRLWMLPYAKIGGGGANEIHSELRIGPWGHLGMRTLINTARAVTIGREVGLGTGTALYTHGAYASALEGKPVAFGEIAVGDRAWIPGAVVNPGVRIGADTVIGVGSVVTRDIPAGALAAGAPCKVLRENAYPRDLTRNEVDNFFRSFLATFTEALEQHGHAEFLDKGSVIEVAVGAHRVLYLSDGSEVDCDDGIVLVHGRPGVGRGDGTMVIDAATRTIEGPATALSERLLNQLRRYGIRFDYDAVGGRYVAWSQLDETDGS